MSEIIWPLATVYVLAGVFVDACLIEVTAFDSHHDVFLRVLRVGGWPIWWGFVLTLLLVCWLVERAHYAGTRLGKRMRRRADPAGGTP